MALQLMLTLDAQVMTVALPTVREDLGFSQAQLSWVPNAYAIAFGGLILLGGRLGDAYGRVRLFLVGTAIFAAASLIGGLAVDPGMLIGARVLQGVGAAVAAPSVLALIITMAKDAAARARGLAYFTATSAIGASAGLILGGLLTDLASWRWGLLVNTPVAILVMFVVARLVRDDAPRRRGKFDIPGAALATAASVSVVWAFLFAADHGWSTPGTGVFFLLAAILVMLLVVIERRADQPLIAIHLLNSRPRVGALINMALILGSHAAMLFMIAQYLQRVLHFSPLAAGVAFLPMTVAIFVVTQWVPALVRHFGPLIPLTLGGVLATASFVLWSTLDEASSYPAVLIPLLIHAIGAALIFTSGTLVAMDRVPDSDAGSASGMLQMVQQIGGSLGIAVVVSVYASRSVEDNFVPGLDGAMLTGAVLAAVATIVALATVRGHGGKHRGGSTLGEEATTLNARAGASG